jgi:hypothetical protein
MCYLCFFKTSDMKKPKNKSEVPQWLLEGINKNMYDMSANISRILDRVDKLEKHKADFGTKPHYTDITEKPPTPTYDDVVKELKLERWFTKNYMYGEPNAMFYIHCTEQFDRILLRIKWINIAHYVNGDWTPKKNGNFYSGFCFGKSSIEPEWYMSKDLPEGTVFFETGKKALLAMTIMGIDDFKKMNSNE